MSVSLGEFSSAHSYEYSGNVARLVLTPLTDRCFLALTTALRLHLGAALVGPAATGKGSTVRELARALGTPCVTFNCSAEFGASAVARALRGVAQSGAWAVLQEANCLSPSTLSALAQMLKQVLDAVARFASPANRDDDYQTLPEGRPNVKVKSPS
jgi:dynein heavy chain